MFFSVWKQVDDQPNFEKGMDIPAGIAVFLFGWGEYQSKIGILVPGGAKKRLWLLVVWASGWEQATVTQQSSIQFPSIACTNFCLAIRRIVCMDKASVIKEARTLAGGMVSGADKLTTNRDRILRLP